MHNNEEDYGPVVSAEPLEINGKAITESESLEMLSEFLDGIYTEAEGKEILTCDSPEVIFSKYLWVIRKLESEIEKTKASAEKLINDIQVWSEQKINKKLDQISFLAGQMENYLRRKDIKSMTLQSGSIGLRKQQPKIEIQDEELFYENADATLLRHQPESYAPDLTAIKQKIKSTGELPPGVEVIEQDSKFFYKLL